MVVVIVKVKLQTNLCLLPYRFLLIVMFVFSSDSFHQNTRPINRPRTGNNVGSKFVRASWLMFVTAQLKSFYF